MSLYLYVFEHVHPVTKAIREVYFYADQEPAARVQFKETFGYRAGKLVRRESW